MCVLVIYDGWSKLRLIDVIVDIGVEYDRAVDATAIRTGILRGSRRERLVTRAAAGGARHRDLRGIFLVAVAIYWVVATLAVGERAQTFSGVSSGMLPPMGLLFGLLVGFVAAQVWTNVDRAQVAVDREASALRTTVLLASTFSGEPDGRMRALVGRYIEDAVDREWPAMAEGRAMLRVPPASLSQGLQLALHLDPQTEGQKVAQREMVTSLENALDARRQRIILSESAVNWVKWVGVILVGLLTLLTIAFVHIANRRTTAIAMGLFATAMATSLVLIAAQERPFTGRLAVKPDLLVQVKPN